MQAALRHLPRCISTRQVRPPVQIDDDAAARIMLRRHNRDWLPRNVDLQFQQPRVNRREMLLDELGGLMADIQMNIIQAKPLDLMVDRTGHHIAGSKLAARSEEHTSELQSLMRISYAVFCFKKKTK